jgi:hypothetical protein
MIVQSSSTGADPIQSVRTYAVYDADGTIVHAHSVVTVEGADETPDDEVERRALELAAMHVDDMGSLRTLRVDQAELERGVRYRVDPKSRSLQPLENRNR